MFNILDGDVVKLLKKVKLWLPVSRSEINELREQLLSMKEASDEKELIIRSDLRVLFEHITKQGIPKINKKPEKNVKDDEMFG